MTKVWDTLETAWWNLVYGVSNLFQWFPLVWRDRNWDQAYLLKMMEFKFRRMALLQEKHGHHLCSKQTARQLRIAATLCKRLHEEPYYDMATLRYGKRGGKAWAEHIGDLEKQDREALGLLIGKHVREWWD